MPSSFSLLGASLLTRFSLLKDLRYYLWGLDVLDESSTKSVFCGLPRTPTNSSVLASAFPDGLAFIKKFTMLHHNGVDYRSTRMWQRKVCAGDVIFLHSGDLCEIDTFILDQTCKEANNKKLFLASFSFIREEQEEDQQQPPLLLVHRTVLPHKKLLSVSEIDCAAVLYPTGASVPSWRVLRLSSPKI